MQAGKRQGPRGLRPMRGMSYLLVLFALAALGTGLAGTGVVWQQVVQREREAELLRIGQQFRQALASYYLSTPGSTKQYPERLSELLEDRRYPVPRRHLRRLYADPMTRSADWVLVRSGGRIVALHSRSTAEPLRSHHTGPDAVFAGTGSYDQWVFQVDPALLTTLSREVDKP